MIIKYNIRAEFPGNTKLDFQVGAESLTEAREEAEMQLEEKGHHGPVEWRGLVAFVGRKP